MRPAPEAVVEAAQAWLGTPYRHQAATPGAGCDCLGLVRGVWQVLYGRPAPALPPYRADWRDLGRAGELQAVAARWLDPAEAGPAAGQIALFRLNGLPLPKHCGILVGPGRFIHARERAGVVETELSAAWARRLAALYLFPDAERL